MPIKSSPIIEYVRSLREIGADEHEIVLKLIERAQEEERTWNTHCPMCNTKNVVFVGGGNPLEDPIRDYGELPHHELEMWKCSKQHTFYIELKIRRKLGGE